MKRLEIISEKLTNWIGTPLSILIHTIFFVGIFMMKFIGYSVDEILLVLTTAVSLEAIYLAIFIQMSVNKTTKSLAVVERDLDEIQEDVDEIQEDVDEIQEDVDEIQEDVDEIQEDVEDLGLDEDEDKIIKTIRDVEKRLTLLHKEMKEIKNKKN
jgi:peptidoglycan hydrolase CwlO-like protein